MFVQAVEERKKKVLRLLQAECFQKKKARGVYQNNGRCDINNATTR